MVDYLVINNNISYANMPLYTVYIIHGVLVAINSSIVPGRYSSDELLQL